ncbi:MAG TPA: YggS family pyridoxal phosphate-dependent enzyme [Candidatus Limnocylindria bacterium]|nr:YggS family pyridoxal phosphate-dependent enzyme [Candidatus Limnocylindria bacterium]
MSALAENLEKVQTRIRQACERAGRNPADITLVAVSKNHPAAAVEEAARLGLSYFGESKIQEARVKIPQCPRRLHWHMIGHLQSNKAKDALGLFEMIESVDSLSLAEELQKQAEKQARHSKILLEVNVAGESSKHGWDPTRVLEEFEAVNRLSRLEIHGLMTIAPFAVDPEKVRPVFARLRELRDRCADLLGAPLPVLSMGMSGDLEVAVEEGATVVRVGTALFGTRPKREE